MSEQPIPEREQAEQPQGEPEQTQRPGDAAPGDDAPGNDTAGNAGEPPAPRWSRRRFLRGVAGSATVALLAACGRDRATPTPTATSSATSGATRGAAARSPLRPRSPLGTPTPGSRVHLPIVSGPDGEAVAQAAATDTPLPTETPTPEPAPTETFTPAPTHTPTPPPATPFPPGPASKLGLHVERNIPQIFDLVATGGVAVVTTLELDSNFLREIKQLSPSTLIVGRIDIPEARLGDMPNPAATAGAFVEQLLPIADDSRRRDYVDGWISYNEPVPTNPEEMQRLAEFEAERTRLLGERQIRSVIGNFATGNPDLSLWPFFFDAIREARNQNGWLGLHEYSAPTIYFDSTKQNSGRYPGVTPQDEGWLTLRYRKVYREYLIPNGLSLPLVFTELGVDGQAAPERRPGPSVEQAIGWRDFQEYWRENGYGLWGPGAYIEQLVWYDEAMRQDDYVLGGCIFGLGTSSRWLSFDIQGPAAAVLEQYLSVHARV